jgi:hypothetical protein
VVVLAFVCALAMSWLHAPTWPTLLQDGCDYAQMGDALHRGDGFTTRQIMPRHIPWMHEQGLLQQSAWPNLYRYPMQPILVAAALYATPDPRWATIAVSSIAFAACVALVAWLATTIGGWAAGVVAAALFLLDRVMTESASAGLADPLAIAFLLLAMALALSRGEPTALRPVFAGLSLALSVLTRTHLAYAVLPIAALIWRGAPAGRGRARLIQFGTAFVAGLLPWMVRNLSVTGRPMFSFSDTRTLAYGASEKFHDIEFELHAPVSFPEVWRAYSDAIVDKVFVRNLLEPLASVDYWIEIMQGVPLAVWPGVLAFVALSVSRRLGAAFLTFAWASAAVFALNFASVAPAYMNPRFHLPIRPFLYVMAACGIVGVLDWLARSERSREVLRVAAVGLAVVALGSHMMGVAAAPSPVSQDPNATLLRLVVESSAPDELVASDASHLIALDANRRSLRLPTDPRELLEIHDRYVDIDVVVLSERIMAPRGRSLRYRPYRRFVTDPRFQARFELAGPPTDHVYVYRRRADPDPGVDDAP